MGMLDSWFLALLTVHDLYPLCTPPTHLHGHALDLVSSSSSYKAPAVTTSNPQSFTHSLSLCGLTCSGAPSGIFLQPPGNLQIVNYIANHPARHLLHALPHDRPVQPDSPSAALSPPSPLPQDGLDSSSVPTSPRGAKTPG